MHSIHILLIKENKQEALEHDSIASESVLFCSVLLSSMEASLLYSRLYFFSFFLSASLAMKLLLLQSSLMWPSE